MYVLYEDCYSMNEDMYALWKFIIHYPASAIARYYYYCRSLEAVELRTYARMQLYMYICVAVKRPSWVHHVAIAMYYYVIMAVHWFTILI